MASGDLPSDTADLSNPPPAGGTDEGRAMAEIVYDEAPGVSRIRFTTANPGPAAKAQGIDALVAAGVKVIADDTSYIAEPFFQDDVIAQAVDRAKAAGVAVFVSAGNDARNAWQGTFTPAPNGMEDFDPSAAVDTMQSVGPVPAHVELDVVLQWAEPWGHAATDFALDVYDITGGTPVLVRTSDARNIQTGLPEEVVPVIAGNAATTYGIAIRRVAGTGSPVHEVHGADQRGADVDRASLGGRNDRPGCRVCAWRSHRRGLRLPHSGHAGDLQLAWAGHALLRCERLAAGRAVRAPEAGAGSARRRDDEPRDPFRAVLRHQRGRARGRRHRRAHPLGQACDADRRAVRDHDEHGEHARVCGQRGDPRPRLRRRIPASPTGRSRWRSTTRRQS